MLKLCSPRCAMHASALHWWTCSGSKASLFTRCGDARRVCHPGSVGSLMRKSPISEPDGCKCHRRVTYSASRENVRIGCASGFWGDTATAVPQLIHGGNLDFLVFDYLSEITMSLLTAAKAKDPNLGFVPDFVQVLSPFIKELHKRGIRVVSNAGGVNPLACGRALQETVRKAGLDMKVAVVTGDDLMAQKDLLTEVRMADSGIAQPLPKGTHSMNAYLGAQPIRRCLDLGAEIVVTGRCVDSAVVLGPLLHTFGWEQSNYDLLAAGSLAGHLVECGAQSTGGIFTDWHTVPDWDNMGFPVAECRADGTFVLSKPPHTGGLVSFGTVTEQLVYEIGDPTRYLLPDVTCDFSRVTITEIPGVDGGAVRVEGAKGTPPSNDYKVCATYMDGFRATAVCPVGGPRAAEKARRTAESIIKRTQTMFRQLGFADYTSVNVQVLGTEDTYGPHATNGKGPREVVLWMAVQHQQKKALELFSREVAPAGTGMAPGLTAIVGGRPRVSPVLRPFFILYPKSELKVDIYLDGEFVGEMKHVDVSQQDVCASPLDTEQAEDVPRESRVRQSLEQLGFKGLALGPNGGIMMSMVYLYVSYIYQPSFLPDLPSGLHSYRVGELAYTRSGDKGDTANIGVIARHPLYYPYLKKFLTASAVQQYFQHLIKQDGGAPPVVRYELPGIHGLNFLLRSSLGGGGVASLRSDPQGKAYGQMLLDYEIKGLPDLKSLVD